MAEGFHYHAAIQNHSRLIVSAILPSDRDSYAELFNPPFAKHEATPQKTAAQQIFAQILSDNSGRTTVLSGEDLCLLEEGDVRHFCQTLRAVFDEIEIVAYVRNHADYARSALQQLLRMGFTASEAVAQAGKTTAPLVLGLVPAYQRRLDIWKQVFGASCLRVFDYDLLTEAGVPTQQHFCDTILRAGLFAKLVPSGNALLRRNEAFSQPSAYILNAMNSVQPLFRDGVRNPGFVFNRQIWLSKIRGPKVVLPIEAKELVAQGIVDDRNLFASLNKAPPLRLSADDYVKDLSQLYAGDPVLDDIAASLERTTAAVTSSRAREKFFVFLPKLKRPRLRDGAVAQMHLALFMLADVTRLTASAGLLLDAGETDLARAYAAKAADFNVPSPALTSVMTRLGGDLR